MSNISGPCSGQWEFADDAPVLKEGHFHADHAPLPPLTRGEVEAMLDAEAYERRLAEYYCRLHLNDLIAFHGKGYL
jgi:hypothetical protein